LFFLGCDFHFLHLVFTIALFMHWLKVFMHFLFFGMMVNCLLFNNCLLLNRFLLFNDQQLLLFHCALFMNNWFFRMLITTQIFFLLYLSSLFNYFFFFDIYNLFFNILIVFVNCFFD
jgi:hypothetical protein